MGDDERLLADLRSEVLGWGFRRLTFGIAPDVWPLTKPIVLRVAFASFLSQFDSRDHADAGLARDVQFLRGLDLGECYYGAASNPIYPFVCQFPAADDPPTARDVLTAVRPRHFRSQHIASLDTTHVSFPGYHPGTENDEIHNEFREQNVFSHEDDVDEFSGTHGALKRYVADERLWYLLLHTTPKPYEGSISSKYVILFTLGKSPHGNRSIGVVTHQVCHNLCD